MKNFKVGDIVVFNNACNKIWIGIKAIIVSVLNQNSKYEVKPFSYPKEIKNKCKIYEVNHDKICHVPMNRNGANE